MEHRWSLRKPYRRPVLISSPQHGLASVRMRDIGLGGMYVETGALALPLNTLVSVEFTLGGASLQEFQLRALVARRTATGAGLMFVEAASDVAAALRHALYEDQRPPSESRQPAASTPVYGSGIEGGSPPALNG